LKQLLQNLKTGEGTVADVPSPIARRGRVLVRTVSSLVSAGTERAFVELGRKSVVGKAAERPDLVKKILDKVKSDGVMSTLSMIRDKLDESHALGYSAAGIVIEVGSDVTEFRAGQRVACAGTGYATHAEILSVPKNLCVALPDNVDFESGAFATVGAIALQGVRLAEPTLGESIVVIGLGLIGQLTVQLLKANGCRVFGVDLDEAKVKLAKELAADDGCISNESAAGFIAEWSRGRGADAVIITAATSSDQPIEMAGEICRLKGRVVAVGLVGLNVPRQIYFQRELTLKVSMSYGPGRYDPEYEEHGHDYPLSYVRWTEGRNLEAFLDLIANGKVAVQPLITHRFSIDEGERAYQLLSSNGMSYLGIVINYDPERAIAAQVQNANASAREGAAAVRLGVIGAGDYARRMLLPHFKTNGVDFVSIATASGVTAKDVGEKYGFARYVSGAREVIEDSQANLVLIATRHDSHAELAAEALRKNLNVFVEKPLALNDSQLDQVLEAASVSQGLLTVGFNRRFSPLAIQAQQFFANQSPLSILYRVNAGSVPRNHWTQDPNEGGGRIIGEVCHFIDFIQFMSGSIVERVFAEAVRSQSAEHVDDDSVFITLKLANGANASIAYLAEGDRALPKERIEMMGGGRSFVIDDFRAATAYENGREKRTTLRSQDKGQSDQVKAVCAAVINGAPSPIPLHELESVTRSTFRIIDSLRTGQPQNVVLKSRP